MVGISRLTHLGGVKVGWRSKNISQWHSRQQVIDTLMASCHLPVVCGILGSKVRSGHAWRGPPCCM